MNRTKAEKYALKVLNRKNFQALGTQDVLKITSIINKVDKDLAKEIIAKFPKLADTSVEILKNTMTNMNNNTDKMQDNSKEAIQAFRFEMENIEKYMHSRELSLDEYCILCDRIDHCAMEIRDITDSISKERSLINKLYTTLTICGMFVIGTAIGMNINKSNTSFDNDEEDDEDDYIDCE